MEREIDILVVEPGKAPRPAKVKNTVETFTEIVGGPIEIGCCLPQKVLLICNGEGKNMGLQPNRPLPGASDYIAGTFFLCGSEEEQFGSLSPAQQTFFHAFFKRPGEFVMIGKRTMCGSANGLAEAARDLWDSMKSGESVVLTKWGGTESGAPD